MYKCPNCNKLSFTWWEKITADRLSPVECKECHCKCYVPVRFGWKIHKIAVVPGALVWIAVLYLKQAWPLVILVAVYGWAIRRSINNSVLVRKENIGTKP